MVRGGIPGFIVAFMLSLALADTALYAVGAFVGIGVAMVANITGAMNSRHEIWLSRQAFILRLD